MDPHDPRLRKIWTQTSVPVVFRQEKGNPLLVRLPYATDNHTWLKDTNRHKPKWDSQYRRWELPVAWFDDIVSRALKRHGKVYVIQLYRAQQKCAPACWNAKGHHCECSCMGVSHGSGHPGGRWHEVSETFACHWGPKEYACRLLQRPRGNAA